jgi:hypothetical protein
MISEVYLSEEAMEASVGASVAKKEEKKISP